MAGTEKRFQDKVVVVTGGTKGIGRACVEAFLAEGARVAVISRTKSEQDSMIKALAVGERLFCFTGDVANEAAVLEFFEKAEGKLGRINFVVNNAAIVKMGKAAELSVEDWDQSMAVNARGVFLCARELFRKVQKNPREAAIVNISSLAGVRVTEKFPGLSAYSASKFAVVGLTECMAVEGRELGVRVNCIAPGAVDTDMLRSAAPHLKTATKPSDIAQSVLYFCDAKMTGKMTGSTLEIYSNIG